MRPQRLRKRANARRKAEAARARAQEADTALRALQRVGIKASNAEPRAAQASAPLLAGKTPGLTDMIFAVLRGGDDGPDEMQGWQVTEAIRAQFDPPKLNERSLRVTLCKLTKAGRLRRDWDGRYGLPRTNEADGA